MTTNAPPAQAEKRLQVQPRPSFLESGPELSLSELKANELTLGRHTYSGILVQVITAKSPLQLLNPLAPPKYGSGWDNVELQWNPPAAGGKGFMLKLFSISF